MFSRSAKRDSSVYYLQSREHVQSNLSDNWATYVFILFHMHWLLAAASSAALPTHPVVLLSLCGLSPYTDAWLVFAAELC